MIHNTNSAMDAIFEIGSDQLDKKALNCFQGRIARKGLVPILKSAANMPEHVLEYFIGQYCISENREDVDVGLAKIEEILRERVVSKELSEAIRVKIRESGEKGYRIIDKVCIRLDISRDIYIGECEATNIRFVVPNSYITDHSCDRMLVSSVWCLISFLYSYPPQNLIGSPFIMLSLKPIQSAEFDIEKIISNRKKFTLDEWRDLLLRSVGYEPSVFSDREKMHLIARMIPFVENNFYLCELGMRGTGKSYMYTQFSPYSTLISGGTASVATLFYNLRTRRDGLLMYWDTVCFDEVAGINFDKATVQTMKDYMESSSFARTERRIVSRASMAFVGNIDDWGDKERNDKLFSSFPNSFNSDAAFFDRMTMYLPGWEVPPMMPEYFTKHYGFISDYVAEMWHSMRDMDYSSYLYEYFTLNQSCSTRDTRCINKSFSGLCKLLFPDGIISKEEARVLLEYAIEGRLRIKRQLRAMVGEESKEYDAIDIGYIDVNTKIRHVVHIPKYAMRKIIPTLSVPQGHAFTVAQCLDSGNVGVYRLENNVSNGAGDFVFLDIDIPQQAASCAYNAFQYFKQNIDRIAACYNIEPVDSKEYSYCYYDLLHVGMSSEYGVAELVALCSAHLNTRVMRSLVIVGDLLENGKIAPLNDVMTIIGACCTAGARNILLPSSVEEQVAAADAESLCDLQIFYYDTAEDAVRIALSLRTPKPECTANCCDDCTVDCDIEAATDSCAEGDGESNTECDENTDTECDTDTDTECDGDTDTECDGDIDTECDTDTNAECDGAGNKDDAK